MSKSPRDTHGPIVKTGPTAGKNRSRNNDGSWRKKRSDTGKSKDGNKGCFLTTAVCQYRGLPDDCYELQTLRSFRDDFLLECEEGIRMVERYNEIAPALVPLLNDPLVAESVWKDIVETVRHIECGEHASAINVYRAMVERL